ncbi:MAG: P-II family nitrogen regulator [bacterium]
MKYILAFVPPDHFHRIYEALVDAHVRGMTVSDAEGFGQEHDPSNPEHLDFFGVEMTPKKRLEIFCHDGEVETIVQAIYSASHTGLAGDGKVFILPVEGALRIKTGEKGEMALGSGKKRPPQRIQ